MEKGLKIALVGSAPSSVRLAPYNSPEWRIWGCSPGVYGIATRIDCWFELHRYEPGQPWFSPEYCQWMARGPFPVVMAEKRPEIPSSVELPVDELVAKYGPYFFTSSLAWMFAMAIEAGAEKIGLWGVDMAACTSYDTRVLTADLRWVRSDSVQVGDKLIAFDEFPQPNGDSTKKRMWRVADVLRADRITKPCYRLFLEDGRELVCSDEHMWLTHAENECRWKMAKDLVTPSHRPGRPSRIIKLMDVWDEDRSWDAGYLAAAFDGEGHLVQKLREDHLGQLRVGFAQRENAMADEVLGACKRMGFDLGLSATDAGVNGNVGKYIIQGGRTKTMEFLGRVRPRRLLEKFDPSYLGIMQKRDTVAVVRSEFMGEQPVIGLKTSTGTFVADGLATHNTDEYGYQRAGCQFFAMLAKARGIEVGVPPESCLLRPPPLYGVSELDHDRIKLLARKRELEARLNQRQAEAQAAQNETIFLRGALDDMNYIDSTWTTRARGERAFCEPPLVPALVGLTEPAKT